MYIGMCLEKKAVFDFHMTRSRSLRDGSLINKDHKVVRVRSFNS